jgi:hypothetical protein
MADHEFHNESCGCMPRPDPTLVTLDSAQFLSDIKKTSTEAELLFDAHINLCSEALNLMEKKNKDYACQEDPYRNFRTFGTLGVLVRLSDKFSRLQSFEETAVFAVQDEKLRDTIMDAINYLVIYYQMKQSK